MSNYIYIDEFSGLAETAQGDSVPIVPMPPIAQQNMVVTTGSTQSNPFSANTKFVRIGMGAQAVNIAFGSNPTAYTTASRLDIYEDPIFCVNPGDKLAIIQSVE